MRSGVNKEVRNFILNYGDMDVIYQYLEVSFKEASEGIFNALFTLIRNYDKNRKMINDLLVILEDETKRRTVNELKILLGPIIDFQNKFSRFSMKERIKVQDPYFHIQNIFNDIQAKIVYDTYCEKVKCLEFLIFHDKNISMIEKYLDDYYDVLKKKYDDNDIFLVVVHRYLCSTSIEDSDYLYHVILTFLKGKYGKGILKNSKYYLNLICRCSMEYSDQVVRLIQLFDPDFVVDYQELEERYHVHFDFSNNILNEVNQFHIRVANRVDFTNQQCITIDGESSLCLDDALSIEKNLDGTYTLYIHIIDVASFVPFSSNTLVEASCRGETLYLRDKNLLLYPPFISEQMCSLLPGHYRNTISYVFKLDPDFIVIPDSFYLTLGTIKVTHRLTYEEVDARINKPQGRVLDDTLMYLSKFAYQRRLSNQQKDIYREYENLVHLKPSHESVNINSSVAANIVHESMILSNYQIAKYFKDENLPYIYRTLSVPSEEFISNVVSKIKKLGSTMGENKAFLSSFKDSYIDSEYSSKPLYHEGLRLECYSHSTSPARRYMDGLGQYIIHDLLINQNISNENIYLWEQRIDKDVRYINDKIKQNRVFAREYDYLTMKKLIKEKK